MNQRTATRLAWGLGLASFALTAVGFIFLLPNYSFPHVNDWPGMFSDGTGIAQSFVFACLGVFLILQRPRNRIGWLVLVVGVSNALSEASSEYSIYTILVKPNALAGGIWVTWLQQWIWIPYVVSFGIILVLFPTGQLLSPRWRWLVYALLMASSVFLVATAFGTPMYVNGELNHPLDNPLAGLLVPLQGMFQIASNVSLSVYLFLFFISLVSVALRFRRARDAEREQIKWFAYAAGFMLLMVFAGNSLSLFGAWSQGIVNLALVAMPVALVIAILRYRLYDIDVIIRRTLIYSVLTAILALFYFGSVVILQQILRPLIGQESDLAVIISTLAIAALFNPVRRRVQEAIDHRFYRRKYDARQVIERFAATARDEVELEKLTDQLLNVVSETMQPAHTSLWLMKTDRGQIARNAVRNDFETLIG